MTLSNVNKVTIFGREFAVKGDVDSGYIEEVASYLNEKIIELSKECPMTSATRLVLMASLNIADELFRLKAEKKDFVERMERRLCQIVQKIENEVSS